MSLVSDSERAAAFREGVESAKLTSRRQAIVRAVIQVLIVGIAFSLPFNLAVRIAARISFVAVGLWVLGSIASNRRVRGKL